MYLLGGEGQLEIDGKVADGVVLLMTGLRIPKVSTKELASL